MVNGSEGGTLPPSSSGSIQVSSTENGLVGTALKFLGREGAVGSVQIVSCSFFIVIYGLTTGWCYNGWCSKDSPRSSDVKGDDCHIIARILLQVCYSEIHIKPTGRIVVLWVKVNDVHHLCILCVVNLVA